MKYLKRLRLFRNAFREGKKNETDVVCLSVFLTNVCLMCYFPWCFLKNAFKMFFFWVHVNTFSTFFFFLKSSWLLGLGGIAFILANPMFPMLDLNPFTALAGGNQKKKERKKKKADMKMHLYSLLMEAVNVWCRWDLKRTQGLMPRCSWDEIKTAHLKNLHVLQIYKNRGVGMWGNRENIYTEKGRDREPSGCGCAWRAVAALCVALISGLELRVWSSCLTSPVDQYQHWHEMQAATPTWQREQCNVGEFDIVDG